MRTPPLSVLVARSIRTHSVVCVEDGDNGSGGWTDRENVIEGNWEHYCGENSPVGCDCSPPSCAQDCPLSCPDAAGKQQAVGRG